MNKVLVLLALLILLAFILAEEDRPFEIRQVARFDEPWAMAFLPDGRLLVTEQKGALWLVTQDGSKSGPIEGVPEVDYGGQGGLGDVALHPGFAENGVIYLSYAEAGAGNTRGAAVARAKLSVSHSGGVLSDLEVIWRQAPKVSGHGHYGYRLLFSDDGLLFISSGERQKMHPAQDLHSNLGKIVRVRDDGSVPGDNPLAAGGGVSAEVWSLGHRNPLGIAFDDRGQMWSVEMGPRGGDELNRVMPGKNYGWPLVSNGRHYSGKDIPDHDTRPDFEAPTAWWTPVISPGGFIFYDGELFDDWRGNGLIAGLSSEALIRIAFDGFEAREAGRFSMGSRMRAVAQGPNGSIWMLEDGSGGRLLELVPR